jgi:hypothetical protein
VQHAFILLKPILIVKRTGFCATFLKRSQKFLDGGFP